MDWTEMIVSIETESLNSLLSKVQVNNKTNHKRNCTKNVIRMNDT